MLEGGALMALELISAKLIAPYFGTSIFVWASVFSITLLGLAIGYLLGGFLSRKENLTLLLRKILLFGLIFTVLMPFTSHFFMSLLLNVSFYFGVIGSAFILLTPSLICFGAVSPIVIQYLNDLKKSPGKNSSIVYTISTLGGVIATFSFGFYFIPFSGIINSIILISIMTSVCLIISIFLKPSINVK